MRDFTPVSLIGRFSYFLVASNEFGPRTLRDMVAFARANPGKVNYATGNAMGIVATAQLMASEHIDMCTCRTRARRPRWWI